MFAKRIVDLNKADLQRIVTEAVQESADVEFKETLPAKSGRDPWLDGGNHISDRARNEIVEEAIAFANAFGGTLLIGVSETKEKPARAAGLVPIPRCAELAERLRLQCRDCIEPQVTSLEIAGVPTANDGSGVVVIRVPRSRLAPHRHTVTRECYARHADRSEKMTMREIQDLTLQVERGLADIDRRFLARRVAFADRFARFSEQDRQSFGVRATLIPLVPLFIDRVHNNESVRPLLVRMDSTVGGKGPFKLLLPIDSGQWRPILRGTLGELGSGDFIVRQEVHCDGLIEYVHLVAREQQRERFLIFVQWVMGLVANALLAAEQFRRAAGTPEVEYGLEFEILVKGADVPIGIYTQAGHAYHDLGPLPAGQTLFPRYSIGGPEKFVSIMQLVDRDFWNAVGVDNKEVFVVDFAPAIKTLGLN